MTAALAFQSPPSSVAASSDLRLGCRDAPVALGGSATHLEPRHLRSAGAHQPNVAVIVGVADLVVELAEG